MLGGDSFEDIDKLYSYINYANMFEDYKIHLETKKNLESEYTLFESKNSIVVEIMNDIDSINKKLDEVAQEIESGYNKLFELKNLSVELGNKQNKLEQLLDCSDMFDNLSSDHTKVLEEKNKMESDMEKINEAYANMQSLNNKIVNINNELIPINNDRDKIKHAIVLAEEYQAELADYKSKYDKIETIKFYSSPTTGIQLLFMDLYMSKIISMANELLQLLFNGNFVLGSFIINENEFRIPCTGENGFTHDDISSMSTAQISMISMILSFALLFQSSTKYNILKLDEIDGALDHNNRTHFAQLLQMQMEILKVDQAFIISHNMEINSLQADIIQLKTVSTEPIEGNVIYRY